VWSGSCRRPCRLRCCTAATEFLAAGSRQRWSAAGLSSYGRISSPRITPAGLTQELLLHLPPRSVTVVHCEFERETLRYSDFPPDAARGLDAITPAFAYYSASAATAAAATVGRSSVRSTVCLA
jgi:hypothetical protein